MAINFPNSPAVNDTFTVGGINFTFTGVKWESGAVVELSSDTTPTLGGNLDGGAKNINNVGVITATGFSGSLTGNVTGNATGLTGDPSIQVTNATVLGNLDVQGTTTTIDTAVTSVDSLSLDGDINLVDNARIKLGVGTDLQIYHDGNNSFIKDTGTGRLTIATSQLQLTNAADSEVMIRTTQDAAVELFHDNSKKLETSATGASITGSLDLPNANSYITGGGHNVLQVDATRTYFYGGTNGVQLRTADNSSEIVTVDNVGNAVFDGTVSDSIGPLRRLGVSATSTNYTLVANDAGKLYRDTVGSQFTVPQNVFTAGDMISIFNVSSSNAQVVQGSGVTLYNSADAATGTRTIAAKGMCTIVCTASNEFAISGTQLT